MTLDNTIPGVRALGMRRVVSKIDLTPMPAHIESLRAELGESLGKLAAVSVMPGEAAGSVLEAELWVVVDAPALAEALLAGEQLRARLERLVETHPNSALTPKLRTALADTTVEAGS